MVDRQLYCCLNISDALAILVKCPCSAVIMSLISTLIMVVRGSGGGENRDYHNESRALLWSVIAGCLQLWKTWKSQGIC